MPNPNIYFDFSEPKKTRLDSDSSSNQTSLLPNNEKTPEANAADSKGKVYFLS